VILDLRLPDVDGKAVWEWITRHRPGLADRVVFMTGGAFTPRAREFLARLPNLRLEKPFDLGHVLSMVNAHLDIASRPASLGVGEEETHAVPS